MYEKIVLSDNVYIEYDIDETKHINTNSLHIVCDGQIDAKMNNGYNRGILASLIEYAKTGAEGPTVDEIAERAWPDSHHFGPDFQYERNVMNRVKSLKRALASVIGDKKANELLPNKTRGFYYKIQIPKSTVETSASVPPKPVATSGKITFKTLRQLDDLGLSCADVAIKITENDIALFGFPENSPEEGSASKWQEFMDEEPVGWGFLWEEETRSIVGNYSSVIISEPQRELLHAGLLKDGELDLNQTESFYRGEDYTLYILNISVNPLHNTPANRELLFDKFFEMILEQAQNGIFFKEIYFTSWRFRKHMKPYGFKECKNIKKDDGSIILGIENFPDGLIWKHSDKLMELYNRHKR